MRSLSIEELCCQVQSCCNTANTALLIAQKALASSNAELVDRIERLEKIVNSQGAIVLHDGDVVDTLEFIGID